MAGPAGYGQVASVLRKAQCCGHAETDTRGHCAQGTPRITQSAMVTFETKVLPQPSSVRFHHEDQEYRYPNGARIIVGGLDDPEKIKSTEFDMIYVQEATELTELDWGMLLSRLRNGVLAVPAAHGRLQPGRP
jgi:hypothetical protein